MNAAQLAKALASATFVSQDRNVSVYRKSARSFIAVYVTKAGETTYDIFRSQESAEGSNINGWR